MNKLFRTYSIRIECLGAIFEFKRLSPLGNLPLIDQKTADR